MPAPEPKLLPPPAFEAELERALAQGDAGRLGLLRWEAQGFPWEAAGARLVADSLRQLPEEDQELRRAIIFTGHMVDAPGRAKPRFPPAKEPIAAAAIHQSLAAIAGEHPGACLGIGGGASGGDLLFHEACAKLGIPSRLRLTLAPGPFIARSVAPAGGDWEARFHSTARRLQRSTRILDTSEELPSWLAGKPGYNVWARTNVWMFEEALASGAVEVHLLALWNRAAGDGPGGTGHLVELASQHGVVTHVLDTNLVFGLI